MIERRKVELRKGQILRIDGPAFIRVYKGRLKIFGKEVIPREYVIIPRAKSGSVEALEDTVAELRIGEGSAIDELKVSFIPPGWESLASMAKLYQEPRILVLGGVDSGKTVLCTYLANALVEAGHKVAVIDEDVGQSEIGPPTTISLGLVEQPIPSLKESEFKDAYFVGSTSPAGYSARILAGVEKMIRRARELGATSIILNTSGFIHGWEAREIKLVLSSILSPNIIVAIEKTQEIEHFLGQFRRVSGVEVVRLPVGYVRVRDRSERKRFRESMYRKFMENARKRVFNRKEVALRYSIYGSGVEGSEELYEAARKMLGEDNVEYIEDAADGMLIVVHHIPRVSEEEVGKKFAKLVIIRQAGTERGLIVGLADSSERFLGIGVVDNIDFRRGRITIWTEVERADIIYFGQVRLSLERWEEQGRFDGFPL